MAGTFEGRARARYVTWLDRIARNEVKMVLRRRGRRTEPATYEVPDADPSARRLSSLVADDARYRWALDQLSAEHRSVIVLREEEGRPYDEIAQLLGLAPGTVRSRLNRARGKLIDLLLTAQ